MPRVFEIQRARHQHGSVQTGHTARAREPRVTVAATVNSFTVEAGNPPQGFLSMFLSPLTNFLDTASPARIYYSFISKSLFPHLAGLLPPAGLFLGSSLPAILGLEKLVEPLYNPRPYQIRSSGAQKAVGH